MAEFKPGDEVRHSADASCKDDCRGVVDKINPNGAVVVRWNPGDIESVDERELLLADRGRPLVGPAPKVEAPKIQATFKADGPSVFDNTGKRVLAVEPGALTEPSDVLKFASYVAEALNEKVNREATP